MRREDDVRKVRREKIEDSRKEEGERGQVRGGEETRPCSSGLH